MKKQVLLVLFIALIITMNNNLYSQKENSFKGTIKYSLSYEGVDAAQAVNMPSTQMKYVFENKQKTVIDYGMYSFTTITDGDKELIMIIISAGGQKFLYKQTKAEIEKDKVNDPKPVIVLSDETKKIAGYTCKKASITEKNATTGEESQMVVWYTDELISNEKINFATEAEGIKGFVLSTEMKFGKITTTSIATEIKKGKVSAIDFLEPADATVLTEEDYKKMFGGGEEE